MEEKIRMMREEKKEKKEDQQKIINEDYKIFSEAYINQFILKIPVEKKEEEVKKHNKR